jgi:hypothetical protein
MATRSATKVGPKYANVATHASATSSSTSGYCGEIGNAQPRHFPRSSSHETMGMLS